MQEQLKLYISPIANPLSGSVITNKIMKLARYLNQQKNLRRGVKDVVKSIKKGTKGICIIAADVSPVDVISHIPILCQDRNIPYIYVRSRVVLGIAAQTKKPTSVILMQSPKNEKLFQKYNKLQTKIKQQHPYL